MTDKEIIINGVNVSECDFFSKGITHNICENLKEVDVECKYNSSCYFKQLKRKEQECEELKKKQRNLEVDKELYDSYCETHCRANNIAINLCKEFSFIEQQ